MPHGPTGIFVTYYFFVSIVAQTSLDVEIDTIVLVHYLAEV